MYIQREIFKGWNIIVVFVPLLRKLQFIQDSIQYLIGIFCLIPLFRGMGKNTQHMDIDPIINSLSLKGYISFSGLLKMNGIDETDSRFADFLFRQCAWA